MNNMAHRDHPVAVIGAGSVGLAAAAHFAQRRLRPRVFSQGVDACCPKNAGAKAHGEEGCGCATNAAPAESASAPQAACCRSAA
ncbi:hypothetical protein [Chelativorans xinjiangense]|uniref:hypothetical protein n=1 Tax=Chelativorans xinjiangense TaxID=2681485 RepID=UPI0013587E73|nr:hypothetical protein [Chelativorans xinjiangense]